MSTLIGTCPGCGEAVDLAKPHTCDRERKLQRALNAELNENFRLRASLAAAREQIARANAARAAAEEKLADERKHATQVATVLCDRIHANTIYIGAVAGLNDFHEDATACISHNMEAINATRDLAGCDRSHERWEVEAQARLREIIAESERRAREACAEADADSAARRQEASDERP